MVQVSVSEQSQLARHSSPSLPMLRSPFHTSQRSSHLWGTRPRPQWTTRSSTCRHPRPCSSPSDTHQRCRCLHLRLTSSTALRRCCCSLRQGSRSPMCYHDRYSTRLRLRWCSSTSDSLAMCLRRRLTGGGSGPWPGRRRRLSGMLMRWCRRVRCSTRRRAHCCKGSILKVCLQNMRILLPLYNQPSTHRHWQCCCRHSSLNCTLVHHRI